MHLEAPILKKKRLPDLASGQVWDVQGSHLEIGLMGKTLVHFKRFKTHTKRAPCSLTSIRELQQFLRQHKAVLRRAGAKPPRAPKPTEP